MCMISAGRKNISIIIGPGADSASIRQRLLLHAAASFDMLVSKEGENVKQNSDSWRFMRLRAQQLYEEGDTRRSLRMMRLINREQEARFEALLNREEGKQEHKFVSTR